MLPPLLSQGLIPESTPSDYLVSAPTGSGKTLAYCIPLIEILSKRQVTRLRALVVLPTRELVVQVKEVLDALAKGTGLKVRMISRFGGSKLIFRLRLSLGNNHLRMSRVYLYRSQVRSEIFLNMHEQLAESQIARWIIEYRYTCRHTWKIDRSRQLHSEFLPTAPALPSKPPTFTLLMDP